MDPRDQKVQMLTKQGFSEDAAYFSSFGMDRAHVDSLRLAGSLPAAESAPLPATVDPGQHRAAADAENETGTSRYEIDVPYRRPEDREGLAEFVHDYGNTGRIRKEIRDSAALLPVHVADYARRARMEQDGIQGTLATYGGRAVGLLWPLIAGQQVVFGKMRGESWRTAVTRLNPTWIDPDTAEETTAWGQWWDAHQATFSDIRKNLKDPEAYRNAIFPFGRKVPVANIFAFLKARPESVDDARKRSEMFHSEGLMGTDLIKAWRAGYGMLGGLAWAADDPNGESIEIAGLMFNTGPAGFDAQAALLPGGGAAGMPISDDPEERATQIADIEGFTRQYYDQIFEDMGPVAAAAAKTTDDWLGLGLDIAVDPVIGLADAPVEIINVLRRIAPSSSSSRVLGAIARRTGRKDAVVAYLTDARRAHEDALAKLAKKDTPVNRRRVLQMESQRHQAEAMATQALRDHPVESIVAQAADDLNIPSAHAKAEDVQIEVVPRMDETYADFIDASTFELLGKNTPTMDKRKLAIMSAVRRNINIGARKNMPEDILRQWERTYELLKNADPEDVPSIVSRFTGKRTGTDTAELLSDTPADFDHLTRSMLIDEEGESILHVGHWDESVEAERVAYGPEDAEWWAANSQDIINGRPVDELQAPSDLSVAKFQSAWAMRPKGVTMEGTIDVTALNRQARKQAKKANAARSSRIHQLERNTEGYALDSKGKLVGYGGKTTKDKYKPGAYERRTGERRANLEDIPGAFERRGGVFLAAKFRKSVEQNVLDDLAELAHLREVDEVAAVKYDWSAGGGNPLKTNVEATAWNRTLSELLGDGLSRGLYPESWSALTTKGVFATHLFPWREPARALQATFPKMWERIRSGMTAKDIEFKRATASFRNALVESGAYKANKKGALEMVDLELNDAMYTVLNTAESSPDYHTLVNMLPENTRNAVRRMRQTFDYYAKKQGIYDSDKYIESYISWMMDPHNMPGFLQEVKNNPSLRVHVRHFMERGGTGNEAYTKNLGAISEVYAAGMSRKMHLEPLLLDMDSMAREFGKLNPSHADWILGETRRINQLISGKPSKLGNKVDSMAMNITETLRRTGLPGLRNATYRPGTLGRGLMGLTSASYAAQLSMTPHYFPMAFSTSLATTAGESGLLSTVHYAAMMSSAEGQAVARAAGISKQYQKIMESGSFRKLTDALSDVEFLTPSINRTEAYIRGIGFHAAGHRLARAQGFRDVGEAILNGHGNAILAEAARYTEEVNHMFGVLGKPTQFSAMSRSLGVAATQFLSFVPKQTEALMAMAMKNPGYFHRYMMVSGWIQRVAATEMGVDLSSYVGMGYLPGRTSDTRSMAVELAVDGFAWMSEMGNSWLGHGDTKRLHDSGARFLETLDSFMPFIRMTGQRILATQAAAMALFEGNMEEYGVAYELTRKYDRDGDFVRKYNFEFPEPDKLNSGMSTDLFAAVSGLRSMNDSIAQEKRQYKRDIEQQRMSSVLQATIDIRKAVRTGDTDKLTSAVGVLAQNNIILDVGNTMRAIHQAQIVEEELRTIMALPIDLRAGYVAKIGLEDETP